MIESINNVVVVGASGTVGSLVGGVMAQNGIKVHFLSRKKEGALKGLERAMAQARSEVIANNIVCAGYDELWDEPIGKADWIIECVTEDLAVKRQMYERIDNCRKPGTIISSVTSSLPLEILPQGRSEDLRRHFLSTHFYNPPGKMPACEITGISDTKPEVVSFMERFLELRLGRVVIPVKNSAGFAGNRIAFLLFSRITSMVLEHGVEIMDYLIGPYTGRLLPPLATLDLVGLDIHRAIIKSLHDNTSDMMHEHFVLPDYVNMMIDQGMLGNKSKGKGGFYKKLESGKFVYFDPKEGAYIPAISPHVTFVERAKELIHVGKYSEAFSVIQQARGPEADIVMEILLTYAAYSYFLIGEVTEANYGIRGIDRVMSYGFHWAGPSLIVKMLGGPDNVCELLDKRAMAIPQMLRKSQAQSEYVFNAGKYFIAN
jgi:3-hydroxyacyl-CoA dehydrogenase